MLYWLLILSTNSINYFTLLKKGTRSCTALAHVKKSSLYGLINGGDNLRYDIISASEVNVIQYPTRSESVSRRTNNYSRHLYKRSCEISHLKCDRHVITESKLNVVSWVSNPDFCRVHVSFIQIHCLELGNSAAGLICTEWGSASVNGIPQLWLVRKYIYIKSR